MNTTQAEHLLSLLEALSRLIQRHNKVKHGDKHIISGNEVEAFVSIVQDTISEEFSNCDTATELIECIGSRLGEESDVKTSREADFDES